MSDLINALELLVQHAARAGAFGDAVTAAALNLPLGNHPLVLSSSRRGFVTSVGTRPLWTSTGVSRHAVDLDNVGTAGQLAAARMIAADLFSAFGEPEPDQISLDGTVNLAAFPQAAAACHHLVA